MMLSTMLVMEGMSMYCTSLGRVLTGVAPCAAAAQLGGVTSMTLSIATQFSITLTLSLVYALCRQWVPQLSWEA